MDRYDENREKLINILDIAAISEKFINTLDEGRIDFLFICRHSNVTGKVAEICIIYPDLFRKVFVLYDYGYCIKFKEIDVNEFNGREGRNEEIKRLYREGRLSQNFIARLFKIQQPTVSAIINKSGKV